MKQTINSAMVMDWVAPYLAKTHPASNVGSLRSFISRAAKGTGSGKMFYTSQADVWTGISFGLDVKRAIAPAIEQLVLSPDYSKIILHGPSGAGKSTLARRILWDLQQRGDLVAFEVNADPTDSEWEHVKRFAKRLGQQSGPPTFLLIDDIHDNPNLIERIKDLDVVSNLRIFSTTWTAPHKSLELGAGSGSVELKQITREEAVAAAKALGKDLNGISSIDLKRLLKAGQFIVLNFALSEGGSLQKFAHRLLSKLEGEAPDLVDFYLDLCACGATDWSVPNCYLHQGYEGWNEQNLYRPALAGLVFDAGVERIRSGHRILSAAVIEAASASRPPRLLVLAERADPKDAVQRRFSIAAIEQAVEDPEFKSASVTVVARIASRLALDGFYVDIRRCARVLDSIGLGKESIELMALATFDRVQSGPDVAAYRADMEPVDAILAFDNVLEFYIRNNIMWGVKSFLHMAKLADPDRQRKAVDLARNRVSNMQVTEGDARVIAELMAIMRSPPSYSSELATMLLAKAPRSVPLARALAHGHKLLSPGLLEALLEYSLPLLAPHGLPAKLASNLASVARRGLSRADRDRLLLALKTLIKDCLHDHTRMLLLRSAAHLCEPSDALDILSLAPAITSDESSALVATRHILARKIAEYELERSEVSSSEDKSFPYSLRNSMAETTATS
ncbi:ATP-binding protein (plasmid) [Rhizobium leguminosarum]|nr:ATP-binding protein [Rhizobium leguminosarum]